MFSLEYLSNLSNEPPGGIGDTTQPSEKSIPPGGFRCAWKSGILTSDQMLDGCRDFPQSLCLPHLSDTKGSQSLSLRPSVPVTRRVECCLSDREKKLWVKLSRTGTRPGICRESERAALSRILLLCALRFFLFHGARKLFCRKCEKEKR